jgi:aminopeptidase N
MTLHQLRLKVGDAAFFKTLHRWTAIHKNGNVGTPQFIRLAERISGKQLDALFDKWLFTPGKPKIGSAQARSSASHGNGSSLPIARAQIHRLSPTSLHRLR